MRLDPVNRALVLTSVVLIALAAGRLWMDSRPPAPLWTLAAIEPNELTRVEIRTAAASVVLAKADSGFQVVEPRVLTADRSKLDALVREWFEPWGPDLKLMDRPGDEDLARFGLDAAQHKTLRVDAGGTRWELEIGKGTTGGSAYLRRVGDLAVYRGRVPGGWQLSAEADDWRDKRLFPFEKDDVRWLVLQGSGGRLRFERWENEKEARWRAEEPPGWDVSSRSLDVLGRALAGLKAQRILEGEAAVAARATAAFDTPRVSVETTTEAGKLYVLRLGQDADAGRTVFASIDGDERVFELTLATLRQLDKTKDDLRDKTVLFFPKEQVAELHWWRGPRHVVAVPEGERDWRIAEPAGYDPSPRDIALAVGSLVNLQAVEVIDDLVPTPSEADPRVEVRLKDGTVHALAFAQRLGPDRTVATVAGKTATYLVRDAALDRLKAAFEAE